ncbi:Intradiol ring-cleavage dioxygenase, partial [Bisporella sp. PMI_857]
ATLLASNVAAHPGHDHRAEAAKRAAYIQKAPKRDLSHCAAKMKARGIEARAVARRAAAAQQARKKRSIMGDKPYMKARDLATVLATDHESATDYTSDTAASILFASNSSCLLSPEVTQGPYWVEGEYVRNDLTDGQEGVSLILDTQVLDVNTCDPVTNAVIEIWNCNSTGVYSGIVASGNGDSSDTSNLDTTFLRGLQPTDSDGVASFSTLFPGHYTGRATHTHVIAHFNGTTFENGTYAGGYASHVGQLFYDQDLISQVELVAPYSTNTQTLTTNAEDSILSTEAASGHDPVINYSFLGDTVEEGIFGWIAFGIDLTSEQTLTPAAYLYESGGVANSNSG